MRSYILQKNFQHRYNKAFQGYVIEKYFGDNILIGEDLLNNDKGKDNDEEN